MVDGWMDGWKDGWMDGWVEWTFVDDLAAALLKPPQRNWNMIVLVVNVCG